MRTFRHLVILVALVALAAGCAKSRAPQHQPQASDSLYTAEAAMRVYGLNPERALILIDSAIIVGNIDDDVAKLLRAKVYSQSLVELRMDTAQQMLLELLESDYTKDLHNREVVFDLLFNIARNKYQIERMLHWATLKADCCREQGHETEALRTEAEIGFLLTLLGEEEKGLAKLSGVIATLDGQRHSDEMDACIIAIKRKISVLSQLKEVGIVRYMATTKTVKNRFPPSIICSAMRISRLFIDCTTWLKYGITTPGTRLTSMSFHPMEI